MHWWWNWWWKDVQKETGHKCKQGSIQWGKGKLFPQTSPYAFKLPQPLLRVVVIKKLINLCTLLASKRDTVSRSSMENAIRIYIYM